MENTNAVPDGGQFSDTERYKKLVRSRFLRRGQSE